jgi:hypothetical protein
VPHLVPGRRSLARDPASPGPIAAAEQIVDRTASLGPRHLHHPDEAALFEAPAG